MTFNLLLLEVNVADDVVLAVNRTLCSRSAWSPYPDKGGIQRIV